MRRRLENQGVEEADTGQDQYGQSLLTLESPQWALLNFDSTATTAPDSGRSTAATAVDVKSFQAQNSKRAVWLAKLRSSVLTLLAKVLENKYLAFTMSAVGISKQDRKFRYQVVK